MSHSSLPAHPNLEQLKGQAKRLLRAFRAGDPAVYPRMLDRAQELASRLDFEDLDRMIDVLEACDAFDDPPAE